MADMEVDAEVVQLPTLQLSILETVQSAQAVHGLKHSEFSRYR